MSTQHSDDGTFDKEHQLFFPVGEVFNPKKFKAFDEWRKANQPAMIWLLANLDKLKRDHRGYCSTARLTASLRDHFSTVQTDETYELNDHIVPYLKRHIVYLRPKLHLFEFRRPPIHTATCPVCFHRFEVKR